MQPSVYAVEAQERGGAAEENDVSRWPARTPDPEEAAPNAKKNGNRVSRRAEVDLTFSDIRYSVQVKDPKTKKWEAKGILHGVSGAVQSGSMMCILGPSGCGKTSLIHIITSKILSGHGREISGAVRCNGVELSPSQFQRISGLVTQEDVFNAVLTVKETLNFAAKLRISANQAVRVQKVVELLQLEGCLSTYVGDDSNPYFKGISGGEKRRLAIATEIIDPDISLLVLDEPTSGLDAAAALNVANLLRSLADTGIAVMATVHQPRSTIVSRFEDLMVLAAGHRIFYGQVDQYVPYIQGDLQCNLPQHENPYDVLLDVLNPLIRQQSDVSMRVIPQDCEDASQVLADVFGKSDLRKQMDARVEQASTKGQQPQDFGGRRAGVAWCHKFLTILHRTFLIKMRDPMVFMTQVSSAIMMGVIFGVIYWQSYDKEGQFVILDTQMVLMMTTMMAIWLPYDVTLTFPRERQIFLRERKSGLYSTSAFYVARISADMPFHILSGTIMALIVYPMAGLQQGLGEFVGVNVLGILVGASLMQMIGALAKSFEEANILMMLIMMLSMVMSTGFIREVPSWLEWMRDISVMGLVGDIAMYFEFRNVDSQYGTPEQVLKEYGIRIQGDGDMHTALFTLLVIYVVARVICFLAVKFMYTGRTCGENLAD